mmetsp:Transcript_15054/g.25573  ORF Transcript_15054/g.25573 Transcript_15054/m.25573 type:complete len:168 (+) Transcript_15054:251-754(+)
MPRGVINNFINEQMVTAQIGQNLPSQVDTFWNNANQDFRRIKTFIFLEKYRDLGLDRCTVCLRAFETHERVKRYPRECDHIFHIKCLEYWMKIQANCPTCFRSFLGPQYTNINLPAGEQEGERAENLSILNSLFKEYDASTLNELRQNRASKADPREKKLKEHLITF